MGAAKCISCNLIEVNGIAHTVLSVTNVVTSRKFYEPLLTFLGMKKVADGETGFYFVGGRTAIGVMACAPEHQSAGFDQQRVGLHHLCFRAKSRADVDAVYEYLKEKQTTIIQPAQDGEWAPGYYSVLFEDPDQIRLEVNFVPGKGLLGEDVAFKPAGYKGWKPV